MANISCLFCSKECFEIVTVDVADKKDKILVIKCSYCKQPAGFVQSMEAIQLTQLRIKR
jgi:transcription elongation factor Elf1